MRQPESLLSLTCQIWGVVTGPDIESDIGPASPLPAKSGEKVDAPKDEMVFSSCGVGADEIPSFCFCPFLRNSSTMLEKPAMAWTARATGLRSERRSMSTGIGAKRIESLFSNASCPARTAVVAWCASVASPRHEAIYWSIIALRGDESKERSLH